MRKKWINGLKSKIYISFADAKGSKKELVTYMKQKLLNEYIKYDYIFKNLNYGDEAIFNDIKDNLINFDDGDLEKVGNSLEFLMSKLEDFYHKK